MEDVEQQLYMRTLVLSELVRTHERRPRARRCNFLLILPTEMVAEIGQHLDQVSTQALRMTCKRARAVYAVGCQTLVPTRGDLWTLNRMSREFSYLRNLASEEEHRRNDGLCCSECLDRHPRRFFRMEELLKPGIQRKCMGSQFPFELCPHQSISVRDVQYAYNHLICGRKLSVELLACHDPQCADISPVLRTRLGDIGVDYTIDIISGSPPQETRRLCPHVCAGDPRVLDTYKGIMLRPRRFDFKYLVCPRRGCPMRIKYDLGDGDEDGVLRLNVRWDLSGPQFLLPSKLTRSLPTARNWVLGTSQYKEPHLTHKLWHRSRRRIRSDQTTRYFYNMDIQNHDGSSTTVIYPATSGGGWPSEIAEDVLRYIYKVNSDCDDSDCGEFLANSDEELDI